MSSKDKIKILVIGESCKDIFIYGKTPRLCPEAPAPVFNPFTKIENGGMAKNVYNNVLALGANCNLFTNENWQTITKTRYIDFNMNHMFLRIDENDDKYPSANVREINFKNYDGIIISDYNKGFLKTEDISFICNRHDNVFLDTKKNLGDWSSKARFIKINNHEYEKTKHTITKEIEDRLIITLSREGCSHKGIVYPVIDVQIKDSSGAGDTFISGFAVKFLETGDVSKAISFANECATAVVQKRGTSTV